MSFVDLLVPDQYVERVQQIDLEGLLENGIRALICDLDNTLVAWGSEEITENTRSWLKEVHSKGFEVMIVSNALSGRVNHLAEQLDLPAIPRANKPRRRGYRRALDMLGVCPDETAVIGDQLFTDVVGGNRLGMKTILVIPLAGKDFVGTRAVRMVEKLALNYLTWRGLTRPPDTPD